MALTAAEIMAREFRHAVRGYDRREVDSFLRDVAGHVSQLQHECQRLETDLGAAQAQVSEGAESEGLLKRTLVAAQRAADETVADARRSADETLASAREEAARVLTEAVAEAEELISATQRQAAQDSEASRRVVARARGAVEQLRRFRDDYRDRVRIVVAEQLAALDRAGDLPDLPDDLDELVRDVTASHPADAAVDLTDFPRPAQTDADELRLEPASALGDSDDGGAALLLDAEEPAFPRRAGA